MGQRSFITVGNLITILAIVGGIALFFFGYKAVGSAIGLGGSALGWGMFNRPSERAKTNAKKRINLLDKNDNPDAHADNILDILRRKK